MNQETTTETRPKMRLPAIFRVARGASKDAYNDGFILFPTAPADQGGFFMDCWECAGGHCAADYMTAMKQSRPATLFETNALKELYEETFSGISGNAADPELVVHRQRTPELKMRFEAEAKRLLDLQLQMVRDAERGWPVSTVEIDSTASVEIDFNEHRLSLVSGANGISISAARVMTKKLAEVGVPITYEPVFKRTPGLAGRVRLTPPWDWTEDSHRRLERSLVERINN